MCSHRNELTQYAANSSAECANVAMYRLHFNDRVDRWLIDTHSRQSQSNSALAVQSIERCGGTCFRT